MTYLCGCYYHLASEDYYTRIQKHYLPLLDSEAHTTILSSTSRTVLKQTFTNPSSQDVIKECIYTFPLYDGVSVVSFTCRIGEKILHGLVKEKVKAKAIFDDAVARGETAGLLEQAPQSSDVFSTKLGNIPSGQSVVVEITYIGELKHHETDGIRFTIPTNIAPRYGSGPSTSSITTSASNSSRIKIVVDVNMPEGSFIKGVQSPSHRIAVSMGTVSTVTAADPLMSKASVTLSLGSSALEKDFVLIVQSKEIGIPKAILETHPTIANHRALMATLVPKFSLPPSHPEIVFVADRSGSMRGNIEMNKIQYLLVRLILLIPLGEEPELHQGDTAHLATFRADMGGTETYGAIQATVERRFHDIPLEVMLLTDGDIWQQSSLFEYVNQQVEQTQGKIRVFPLGIGNGVSHSLIEGLARAGNGFAQAVQLGERLENSVVRMLRGALSPHITDYTLEVKYAKDDDDFEVIEKVTDGMKVLLVDSEESDTKPQPVQKPTISLFDPTANPEKDDLKTMAVNLPSIPSPKLLQAPHSIPSLFAFSRTSVYLLMSPDTIQRNPTAVVLRATCEHGPLELEIPIEILSTPDQTIHQLAAKKAVQDLEEGRGWIYDAKDQNGMLVKDKYPSCFEDLVKKDAVRLGEKFQVAGKYCSFVAVSANDKEKSKDENASLSAESLASYPTEEFEHSERSIGFDSSPVEYSFARSANHFRGSSGRGGFAGGSGSPDGVVRSSRRVYRRAAAPPSQPTMQSVQAFKRRVPSPPPASHAPSAVQDFSYIGGAEYFTSRSMQAQPLTRGATGDLDLGFASVMPSPQRIYGNAPSDPYYDRSVVHQDEEEKFDAMGSVSVKEIDWSSKSAAEKVLELISLQDFEGSWAVPASKVGEIMVLKIPKSPRGGGEKVWVTLLVINFLEQKMATEEGTWALVVEKARGWLAGLGLPYMEELEKEAFELIKKQ